MYNQNTRRGFTLIELLVVVLIIAILAAVALPQYQKAIAKTRFENFKNMANTFYKATQIYYMQHDDWPHSLDELDVSFSGNNTSKPACKINGAMFCCLLYPMQNQNTGQIVCGQNDYSLAYKIYFSNSVGIPVPRSAECLEAADKNFCSLILGTKPRTVTNFMMTPDGWKSVHYYSAT